MSAWISELSAADRIQLLYLGGLGAFTAAQGPPAGPVLLAIAALAAAIAANARLAPRSAAGRFVHDFSPVATVIALFSLAGFAMAGAESRSWDAALARLDHALFGDLPAAWLGLLGRPAWLTDLASALYASYYGIPVAMGWALRRRDRRAFEHFVFMVVATFVISFIGYGIFPALGPRVPSAQEATLLGGGATSELLRAFLRVVELNRFDAFPSGHTALALMYVGLGWEPLPRWRPALAVLAAGIVFSGVYLSLHYVIDLVAGAVLAAGMAWLGPRLERRLAPAPRAALSKGLRLPAGT